MSFQEFQEKAMTAFEEREQLLEWLDNKVVELSKLAEENNDLKNTVSEWQNKVKEIRDKDYEISQLVLSIDKLKENVQSMSHKIDRQSEITN